MRVVVVTEQRFLRSPDGRIWVNHTFTSRFWHNYLLAFDRIRVIARILSVKKIPSGYSYADGEAIEFHGIPSYQGPFGFLKNYPSIRTAVIAGVDKHDAVILRLGSQLANILFPMLRKTNHPYAVEVVGDPWDVFAPGVIDHPLRPLFRYWFSWNLRRQCLHANAAAYVTKYTLQKRYPIHQGPITSRVSVGISDAAIDDTLLSEPQRIIRKTGPWQLALVGSLEQQYKGVDVALQALTQILSAGLHVRLVVVGEGRLREKLEIQARDLGVAEAVSFYGSIPRMEVLDVLRRSDLFIIPSRTEGLPRALVEALALGVPAIGSNVGGIPELLDPTEMVPPGEFSALANLISMVLKDPNRRVKMSERNRKKAHEFQETILREKRTDFYRHIRRLTEDWIRTYK